MNFIFLFAVLTVIGFIVGKLIDDHAGYRYENWSIPFFGLGLISVVTLIILIIVCAINTATATSNNYEMLETQTALIFKLENADIRDEFGLLNKSFVDDVEAYNKKIVVYKARSENPWISAFYPKKVVEGCERIDYERFVAK